MESWSPRNEERARKVEGREGKKKYYCVLSVRYRVGDIIPGRSSNSSTRSPAIFLTTSQKPHFSLQGRENLGQSYIYRVLPVGKIKTGVEWSELSAPAAEVVEVLGLAQRFVEKEQYSYVKLRTDPLLARRTAEYYHELNSKNPNEEGKNLLDKLDEKTQKRNG